MIHQGDVLAVAVTIPLVLLLTTFINQSRMGRAMRATAQDPEAARLMGINVDTTISLTFLLGGLMAGAAGLVYALYQTTIWYFQGFQAGLIAFTAAVMGGIGNLQGAVLGGFIIGIIQQTSDNRIGGEWTPAIVFAYLVLIMVFRPRASWARRRGKPASRPKPKTDQRTLLTAAIAVPLIIIFASQLLEMSLGMAVILGVLIPLRLLFADDRRVTVVAVMVAPLIWAIYLPLVARRGQRVHRHRGSDPRLLGDGPRAEHHRRLSPACSTSGTWPSSRSARSRPAGSCRASSRRPARAARASRSSWPIRPRTCRAST